MPVNKINRKQLLNKKPNVSIIEDCYKSFDLIMGKNEDLCFNLAKNGNYKSLIDNINAFYSTRTSKKERKLINSFLIKNKNRINSRKYDNKLVNDIANVNNKKGRQLRSLASKIMYFINSDNYPIYDSYAREALIDLNSKYNLGLGNLKNKFMIMENKKTFNYDNYRKIVYDFKKAIKSKKGKNINNKKIDKYLWIYGKNL